MSKESSPPINPLAEIYSEINQFPVVFRNKILEECNWSLPTFYRKVKSFYQTVSNAELDKIVCVSLECLEELEKFIEPYTRR